MDKRPQTINPAILGSKVVYGTITLDQKIAQIYAIGIGFNRGSSYKIQIHLKHQTLNIRINLIKILPIAFPTLASCLGQQFGLRSLLSNPNLPQFPIHAILHGQQKLYMIHQSLKTGVPYHIQQQFIDIADKGPKIGCIIIGRISAYQLDSKGNKDLAYYIDRSIFIKSLGGKGGNIKSTGKSANIPNKPNKQHDIVIKDSTFVNQAILYRLVSDPNPLHIDSNMAALAGFPKPIIHGLATHGTVVRAISQNLLDNFAQKIKSVQIRFTGHVFPGQSLEIKLWKLQANKYYYQVQVVQRKKKAISGLLTIRQQPKL